MHSCLNKRNTNGGRCSHLSGYRRINDHPNALLTALGGPGTGPVIPVKILGILFAQHYFKNANIHQRNTTSKTRIFISATLIIN